MIARIAALLLIYPLAATAQTANSGAAAPRPHDSHDNLTITADPYITAERYKDTFGKNSPYPAGIIAVDVSFENNNDIPIRISPDTIRLVISLPSASRQRLGALSPEEVADRAILTTTNEPKVARPFPLPGMNRNKKGKEWNEMDTLLSSVALSSDIVAPHGSMHGFLYFDMDHDFSAIRNSHLYIPDLVFMTNKKALFYFEIDLASAPGR